jgi:cystathionine beta-lyase
MKMIGGVDDDFVGKALLDSLHNDGVDISQSVHYTEVNDVKCDFNKIIDRRHTDSAKWAIDDNDDMLPLWIADMDFASPQPVIDAIKKRAEMGIYGYAIFADSYYEAINYWMMKRHGLEIRKEWVKFSPGIVSALHMLIKAFTKPGDKVIIQKPVYYPFFGAIESNRCQIVDNPLKYVDGKYTMDFEDLEAKAKDNRTKVLILCSPHNPVGRVWTKEELTRLGEICLLNNVIVISDEIHSDLIYRGYKHTPFISISEKFTQNSVTCIAPSKTFNLAGLQTSVIIVPNEKMKDQFTEVLKDNHVKRPNVFGAVALEAGYRQGEEWLEQLLDYLQGNLDFLTTYINEKVPQIKVVQPQGTYLIWLDCRKLGMTPEKLKDFITNKAKLWLDDGYIFGESGEGFERINIACPRIILTEALRRLESAVRDLNLNE